jgi:hypothetical protein
MHGLIVMLLLLLATEARSHTLKALVAQIDYPAQLGEETLIYMSNGQVLKIAPQDLSLTQKLEVALEQDLILEIGFNDKRQIISVATVAVKQEPLIDLSTEKSAFRPSIIESYDKTVELYKNMRRGSLEDSQCYNRAHVWAYDWKKKLDINSMKVWIYFTRKYIRAYNFEWWFHVSPFLYVREDNAIVERIMDYKFTYAPLGLQDWINRFMKNKVHCPVIMTYSDYKKEADEDWCYIMKTNMFYYQPLDMYNLEKIGDEARKTFFKDWEVRNAYRQAYGIRID